MTVVSRLGLYGGPASPYAFERTPSLALLTFATVQGVPVSTPAVESNTITVQGLSASVAVTITGDVGYAYSKNGGAFVTGAGTAQNGDTFAVRVDASALNNTGTGVQLTIGAVTLPFAVITERAAPVLVDDEYMRLRRR